MPAVSRKKLELARGRESKRLQFVLQRDGVEGALQFARKTLTIYQTALRYKSQDPGKPPFHFARSVDFIDEFVGSILEFKHFLRQHAR